MNIETFNQKKQTTLFYSNNPLFVIFTIIYLLLIICLSIFLYHQLQTKEALKISLNTLQQQSNTEKALYQNQLKSSLLETDQNLKYQEAIKEHKQSMQINHGEYIALEANIKITLISVQNLQNEINIKKPKLTEIQTNHFKLKSILYSNKLDKIKSTILRSNEEIFFLEQEANKNIEKVIYSSEIDGFSLNAFHQICNDDIKPTFTVYQTISGSRFGGYTTVSFVGNDIYKYDEEAFMFNLNKKEIYQVMNKKCAVHADKLFFPSFDGDALFVDSKNGNAVIHKVKGLTDGLKKFEIEKIEVLLASSSAFS